MLSLRRDIIPDSVDEAVQIPGLGIRVCSREAGLAGAILRYLVGAVVNGYPVVGTVYDDELLSTYGA